MSLRTFDNESVDCFARRFERLFYDGDAAAMAAYYTEDAEVTAPDSELIKGRPTVEAFFKAAAATASSVGMKRDIEIRHVESSGDLGYVLSKVVLKIPTPGSEPASVVFHDVTVWKRCADGNWRMVADSANRTSSTLPPPTSSG